MPKQHRKAVLFVCTGNAGRSQMAAALFSSAAADDIDVYSAGVDPWPHLHPVAVRLLEGRGIETGDLCPKHVCGFTQTPLDWVVTIGDRARAETPIVDSKPTCVHWPITDPAEADGTGREEAVFRGTLAAIEDRLPRLLAAVQRGTSASALHLEPGLSTCIVRPSRFDPPVHLPVLASAGFTCVELNCYQGSDDFPWDRPARVKELCRTADETGVRVYSVHADGGLGAYRGDRSERFAVDVCKTYADLAAELGASIVTIHAGLPGDASPSEGKELLGRSLEALSSHVRDMPCAFGCFVLRVQRLRSIDPTAGGKSEKVAT